MRNADAVSTADRGSNTSKNPVTGLKRELGSPELRARMEELLQRYPDISQEETQDLLKFLKSGPHVDVGLVTGEDSFRDKIRQIRTRYAAEFRLKAHETILFIALICAPLVYLAAKYLLP